MHNAPEVEFTNTRDWCACLAALGEEALKWPCYECIKKFRTSLQLQKHLLLHERAETAGEEGGATSGEDAGGPQPVRRVRRRAGLKLRSRTGRRRGRPAKKSKVAGSQCQSSCIYNSIHRMKHEWLAICSVKPLTLLIANSDGTISCPRQIYHYINRKA